MPCYCCRYVTFNLILFQWWQKKESLISNATTCEVVWSGVCVFRSVSPPPIYSGSILNEQCLGAELCLWNLVAVVSYSSLFLNFTKRRVSEKMCQTHTIQSTAQLVGFECKGNYCCKDTGCQLHATRRRNVQIKGNQKIISPKTHRHMCVDLPPHFIYRLIYRVHISFDWLHA